MGNRKQTIPMGNPPKTVDEVVDRLISEIPLKDRVTIANMNRSELKNSRIPGTVYVFLALTMKSVHAVQMARIARVVVEGMPHHITQRGNRRQKTFFRMRIMPPM